MSIQEVSRSPVPVFEQTRTTEMNGCLLGSELLSSV